MPGGFKGHENSENNKYIYIYIYKQQEEVTVGGIEFLRKVDESFSFTFSGVEK